VDLRVLDQVRDGAADERRIDRSADVADRLDRLRRDAGRGRGIAHELAEVELPPVEVAELEARLREQPADQVVEHEHLALELRERLRVVRVARGLDQHAHVAERRAQLVRHRREELALVGELLLDLRRHLV